MLELLSPCGDFSKLKTAVHFGADAVYLGGNNFSLRAFAGNFSDADLKNAFEYLHQNGKKGYVTTNIFAQNEDFGMLREYFEYLRDFADGVIISDIGVFKLCQKVAPNLELHISTQANTLNKYAAEFWAKEGAKRIVLARELSLAEIKEIREYLPATCTLEAFVHGAMCISYSGRCLLSNYLTNRNSNRGECVQACRWEYAMSEKEYDLAEYSRRETPLSITEDKRGSYILNSKDLNMFEYLEKMIDAGIESFKIEGRMKSEYYVGTITNAYAKALASIKKNQKPPLDCYEDLFKIGHRQYTTAYAQSKDNDTVCYTSAQPVQTSIFIAKVEQVVEGGIIVEQRNLFKVGDTLEVLSAGEHHNAKFIVTEIFDLDGNPIEVAKNVQQKLLLKTSLALQPLDMLRKEI